MRYVKFAALLPAACLLAAAAVLAQNARGPSITIYNDGYAVVREHVPLVLTEGRTTLMYTGATAFLEPASVVLRDPAGRSGLRVIEQNYMADPVTQQRLLEANEGKLVDFLVQHRDREEVVTARVVRAGQGQPLLEVDGKLRFGLPGLPMFDTLGDDVRIKPTLRWVLEGEPGPVNAEVSYITNGMRWHASYNLVLPDEGDAAALSGWVTLTNTTGRAFDDVQVKLIAGDVRKITEDADRMERYLVQDINNPAAAAASAPVQERTFDEFHLYTLTNRTRLHDGETKQVEFIDEPRVQTSMFYSYEGLPSQGRYEVLQGGWHGGAPSRPVSVMREFKNNKESGLGMPLPEGRIRAYRRDGGRIEFIGESTVEHTPKDETVRIVTGRAFDVLGERITANAVFDHNRRTASETIEITLRNHKDERIEVRVVEHLYTGANWNIAESSDIFKSVDADTIEFRVQVPENGEKKIKYVAKYTW